MDPINLGTTSSLMYADYTMTVPTEWQATTYDAIASHAECKDAAGVITSPAVKHNIEGHIIK